MLFTLLAEASLDERRRRVEEAKKGTRRVQPRPARASRRSAWAYREEEESIERRDLFRHPGDLEWDDPAWEKYRENGNPFANFLKRLAKNLEADNGALDPADVEFDPDLVCRGHLFPRTPRKPHWRLTARRVGPFPRIRAPRQIPKRLCGEGEDVTRERAEWLEAQITDDEWADCEAMMANAVKLGKMLTGEFDPEEATGE